jgi:hypothetical protein
MVPPMRACLPGLLLLALLAPNVTFAGDDDDAVAGGDEDKKKKGGGDDDPLGGDDDDEPKPKKDDPGADGPIDIDGDDTLDDSKDEGKSTEDLLGEEVAPDKIGGPGQDNSEIYRKFSESARRETPDEEMLLWDKYLEKYPNSLFKERIDKRVDELAELYGKNPTGPGRLDADKSEMDFSQALLLPNINPRTRLQAGFEWGLPNYINLFADYEHQLARTFSFHGGLKHAYPGWRIEGGVRWALLKSARTHTIITVIGDLGVALNPAFPFIRPQLAIGQKIGRLDLQLMGGAEIETRKSAGVKAIGGFNATYTPSDTVGLFVETGVYMQSLNTSLGGQFFRFNNAAFGLKFWPSIGSMKPKQFELNIGASVPYAVNYWQFHYGSIMGQVNYAM